MSTYYYVIIHVIDMCWFSLLDNPYDTADKWLLKENLPLSYRQQIVDFILENTGQKSFSFDPSFRDPYTGCELKLYCLSLILLTLVMPKWSFFCITANAYVPGETSLKHGMHF